MEGRPLISETLLTGCQSSEVLRSFGDSSTVKTNYDATQRLLAMADIEVDFAGDLRALDSFGSLGEEEEGDGEDQNCEAHEILETEHLESK